LKIDEKNLPAITFADSDKARAGDVVLALGAPFGLRQTATMGIISAVGRGRHGDRRLRKLHPDRCVD
jgi:serine protease DegQ